MSFGGYLLKINTADTNLFNSYIVASSYKVTKKIIDVDSYRDANGKLHRNAMDHLSYTIEFNIKPLNNERLDSLLSKIRSAFTVPKERKLDVTFYLPENDDYVTASCYMPDIDFPINHIENGKVYYNEITLKFIGY